MGIFKSLFGNNEHRQSRNLTFDEATDIAGDYGDVLEHAKGMVCDSAKLPYQKAKIKEALLVMLGAIGNGYMKEQLKIAYILLADFQDGVGPVDIALERFDEKQNRDNVSQQLEKIRSQSALLSQWMPIIQSEREQLVSELQELGYWNG